MKRYKLITKYPSLPKTMEVGFEVEWSQDLNRYHHALTLDLFSKADVENFPEFWEEKEPLITSYDGVEIYEGGTYWFVWDKKRSNHEGINGEALTPHKVTDATLVEGASWTSLAKYFSTEEKAIEYVRQNKPIFSLKDLAEIMEGNFTKSIKELLKDS